MQRTTGHDLGLIEHPAPNLELGDVVMLAQEALKSFAGLDAAGGRPLGPTVRPKRDADGEHPDEQDEKTDEDDRERE